MPDSELLRTYINTIRDEAEEKLSDWERNFIESIDNQLTAKGTLSIRQAEIVERIYKEKIK